MLSATIGFLDLGRLALQAAQIIKLCPTDMAAADDLDGIHARRMHRERAFNTDTIGDAANGKGFTAGAVALCDHHTLERLKTFAAAFDDLDEHTNGVANAEVRQIGTELLPS